MSSENACCQPNLSGPPRDAAFIRAINDIQPANEFIRSKLRDGLVEIPGGFFEMGARKSTYPDDLDSPRRRQKIAAFLLSPTAVTNAEFEFFTRETGYKTVAEQEGWSFVFHLALERPSDWPESPPGLRWWRKVDGASFRTPEGPDTSFEGRENHPAIHIAWYDALAYCKWAGLRLPHEVEWERAARGGLAKMKFPWGNALCPDGAFAMNTWQGVFPDENTAEDGYTGTAPVDAFRPNTYGLYNMTGNVWEWTADTFGPLPPAYGSKTMPHATSAYARTQRGGSFLCHESYCDRYHVHSRSRNDPDSSTGNGGFRVAADVRTPGSSR